MAFQGDSIYWVEVEKIVPNPFQPRREFDEAKLKELSESIRMYGVLQPLTVTRKEVQREDGTFYTEYELIAGERRLRASKLGGISQVPVLIRDGEETQQEKLELAIIENLQREDLNAVDRALAFKQLADEFAMSHADVAKKVGRSREYVSNSIRLLALPEHMLDSLKRTEMMEGHARTLLMLTDRPEEQEVVFKEILLKKLSVREVERIVRKIATDKVRKKNPGEFDSELIEMEKQFTETLGTRVQIQKTDFGGKLTIDYFSVEDLEGLLARVRAEAASTGVSPAAAMAQLSENTPLDVSANEPAAPTGEVASVTTEPNVVVETKPQKSFETEQDPVPEHQNTAQPEPVEKITRRSAFAPQTLDQSPIGDSEPIPSVLPDADTEQSSVVHTTEPTQKSAPAPETDKSTTGQISQPTSGLAAALARAIGKSTPAQPTPAPVIASSPESTVVAHNTEEVTAEEQLEQTDAPAPSKHPDQDESTLYSIRNFNV